MKFKGTILLSVLYCFVYISTVISIYTYSIYINKCLIRDIDLLFKQKNIELMTLYIYENLYNNEGILLNDEFEVEGNSIKYEIETLDNYYIITTCIDYEDYKYSYQVKLNLSDGDLYDFEYI